METMKIIKIRFPWYLLVSVLILGSGCATTEMAIKPITLERPGQKPQAVETEEVKQRGNLLARSRLPRHLKGQCPKKAFS